MKKITLFVAAAIMLFMNVAHAQYVVTLGSGDQLAAQPSMYTVGSFVCQYTGGGSYSFTGIDALIIQTRGSDTILDYSKISSVNITLMYNTSTGSVTTAPFYVPLTFVASGLKKVSLGFPAIVPSDGMIRIFIAAQFLPGIDTMCSLIQSIGAVTCALGSYTTPPVVSNLTYVEDVLAIAPVGVSDRIVTSLPQFSQIVGTFYISVNKATALSQLNIQTTGDFGGYLPEVINPRLVDSAGNTLWSGPGFSGSSIGFGITPIHLDSGQKIKVYVLSDILSASYGDYMRIQMSGGCGTVDPFLTVNAYTFFCSNENTRLGERVTYEPPTGINIVNQSGVSVYPNPVTEKFTISCVGMWSCDVYNITGKIVQTFVGNGPQEFSKGNLSGFYIVAVTHDGVTTRQKVTFQ